MDILLAKINRRVKHLEKHLDIKIVYQGEEIETLFERFSAFSNDNADIILYASEKLKRIKLHYDFNTGNLTDLKTGSEIEIMDLFSNRHLQSILFIAHESLFLNSEKKLSAFSNKIHKDFPVPLCCTENGPDKKWFLIESLDVVGNSKVCMKGLLSVVNTVVHQPIKASCVFDITKELFTWEYFIEGKKNKEVENEKYYSWYKIKMSDILYAYTELKIDKTTSEQGLVNDMLKVFKKQKIFILSKKKFEWGSLTKNYILALFWGIKTVNDEEIVLLACDGESLNKEVHFNRIDRKIYASMPVIWRKKMQELEFTHNRDGNKDKFYKAIKLIERNWKPAY